MPRHRSGTGWMKRCEPLAGCEVQQTRGPLAEEAVEVVGNHEGGTGLSVWNPAAEDRFSNRSGVDASVEMSAGRRSETQERRSPRGDRPGRGHTLKERRRRRWPDHAISLDRSGAAGSGNPCRPAWKRVEGQEGSGEDQRAATGPDEGPEREPAPVADHGREGRANSTRGAGSGQFARCTWSSTQSSIL
jgi:hypothetical protein